MLRKTALIIAIILIGAFAYAEQATVKTPDGYEWSSDKGALRQAQGSAGELNKYVYVFDTYENLTASKDAKNNVPWGSAKLNSLTELGKDLRARLLKVDDVESVFVGHRVIMFRRFALSEWPDILPSAKKALE
jgi:hypothetical protein